ncbi:hypothetical protein [Streptomyces sp. NPDC059371]|uniref:hypothetical protein n=1 Tax=Streptomyces sp. NPDC059371 TaxID=3346812 RepID=UPI0036954518
MPARVSGERPATAGPVGLQGRPNTLCIAASGANGFTGVMTAFFVTLTGFWPSRRVDLFDGFCRRDV